MLLKNAKIMSLEEKITGMPDEKLTFLYRCLELLEPYQKDVITKTYIEGVSMRKFAIYSGFSRNFVAKVRKETVELLARFFTLKFC